MCTTRLIATCWNSSKNELLSDNPVLVLVYANRNRLQYDSTFHSVVLCLLLTPFPRWILPLWSILKHFLFKGKYIVLFLFMDQVCKCVLNKKSESIYKQNSLFKEVLPHWYCGMHNSFVTIVHKSLVYKGMV